MRKSEVRGREGRGGEVPSRPRNDLCPIVLLSPQGPQGLRGGGGAWSTLKEDREQPQEREMGRKQVTKRSTYARPGMHMQQCSGVPEIMGKDTDPIVLRA